MKDERFRSTALLNKNLIYVNVSILTIISISYGIVNHSVIGIDIGILFMAIQSLINFIIGLPIMTRACLFKKINKKQIMIYIILTIIPIVLAYVSDTFVIMILATFSLAVYLTSIGLYFASY